jgi:ABC-type multidrug transport system fused ATPase/permease subunit
MNLAADYPLLNLFWTFVWFFGLMLYFWLLITVFADLFRRKDIGAGLKTLWVVFLIVLPLIGSFTYLITQGRHMAEREMERRATMQQQTDEYIRSVASTGSSRAVDEIARGKQLLDNGAISEDEFQELKRRVLV